MGEEIKEEKISRQKKGEREEKKGRDTGEKVYAKKQSWRGAPTSRLAGAHWRSPLTLTPFFPFVGNAVAITLEPLPE